MDQQPFLDLLVHHWHNLRQAQMWPSSFAYIHYLWYFNDEGRLASKQWYDWNGEVNRERTHNVVSKKDHILLETFNADKKMPSLIFTESERGWIGKNEPNAHNGRGVVVSTITLTKDSFESDDKGYDEEGELLWGSKKGPFLFSKCTASIPTSVMSSK